jgi:hypothetical protein
LAFIGAITGVGGARFVGLELTLSYLFHYLEDEDFDIDEASFA